MPAPHGLSPVNVDWALLQLLGLPSIPDNVTTHYPSPHPRDDAYTREGLRRLPPFDLRIIGPRPYDWRMHLDKASRCCQYLRDNAVPWTDPHPSYAIIRFHVDLSAQDPLLVESLFFFVVYEKYPSQESPELKLFHKGPYVTPYKYHYPAIFYLEAHVFDMQMGCQTLAYSTLAKLRDCLMKPLLLWAFVQLVQTGFPSDHKEASEAGQKNEQLGDISGHTSDEAKTAIATHGAFFQEYCRLVTGTLQDTVRYNSPYLLSRLHTRRMLKGLQGSTAGQMGNKMGKDDGDLDPFC